MKVSQKLEYACRAMIQLGKSCVGDQVFRVDDLADKESISSTFLVQILNDLRRAGLVQSRRGKMGGYCLAKAPSEITMDTIVRAVEGDVLGIDSDRKGESGERVADIWMEIAEHLETKMASITLQEMISNEGLLEYHI
ncbi:MAG: Rrf2 family transcriptional regulator [Verrucomicrobiales bacterium]|nr:Rrf2 family transcriptional regulator [Verrucomicrobiaceae bacterium]